MLGRALRLAPYLLALLPLLGFTPTARAGEGDPPAEPPKKEKPQKDDTSIFADWKIVKGRGSIGNAKDRAAYWEQKGATGMQLCWLGYIANWGELYEKAAAVWEQWLDWTPPEGPEKEAVDARKGKESNAEGVRGSLVNAYIGAKKYDEAVAAAQKFREQFPSSTAVGGSWDNEGRAQHLAGRDDKALEAFAKCAEMKVAKGLLDYIDVLLLEGKVDEATASFTKFPMDGPGAVVVEKVKPFLLLIGSDAPSLEKAVSVGRGDAPKEWKGKATAVYFWHMQLSLGERRMTLWDKALREVTTGQTFTIATYNKLNPVTQKVEPDMTGDQEIDWYKKQILEFTPSFPASIVVPQEVITGLGIRTEGQTVIVDAEGKIRYQRLNDQTPYDLQAIRIALKKFSGG